MTFVLMIINDLKRLICSVKDIHFFNSDNLFGRTACIYSSKLMFMTILLRYQQWHPPTCNVVLWLDMYYIACLRVFLLTWVKKWQRSCTWNKTFQYLQTLFSNKTMFQNILLFVQFLHIPRQSVYMRQWQLLNPNCLHRRLPICDFPPNAPPDDLPYIRYTRDRHWAWTLCTKRIEKGRLSLRLKAYYYLILYWMEMCCLCWHLVKALHWLAKILKL